MCLLPCRQVSEEVVFRLLLNCKLSSDLSECEFITLPVHLCLKATGYTLVHGWGHRYTNRQLCWGEGGGGGGLYRSFWVPSKLLDL